MKLRRANKIYKVILIWWSYISHAYTYSLGFAIINRPTFTCWLHWFFTVPPAPTLTVIAMYDTERKLIRITSQINISVSCIKVYFTGMHCIAISNQTNWDWLENDSSLMYCRKAIHTLELKLQWQCPKLSVGSSSRFITYIAVS